MIHKPNTDGTEQTVEGVVADLTKQRDYLAQSIDWIKNVSAALASLRETPSIDFFTTVITNDSRHVEVGFYLPVNDKRERITVFTIACSYTQDEMIAAVRDDLDGLEVLNRKVAQKWLESYRTRPFEVWIVADATIWHDDEGGTTAWVTKQVREWLKYWFKHDYKARWVQRPDFGVTYLGQRASAR